MDDTNVLTQAEMENDPHYQVKLPQTDKVAADFPVFTDYLDYLVALDKSDPLEGATRIGLNLKRELDAYDADQARKAALREASKADLFNIQGILAGLKSAKEAAPETFGSVNLATREGLATYMRAAQSERDWNSRIDNVKRANGGSYPDFWFSTIIMSGLAAEVQGKW